MPVENEVKYVLRNPKAVLALDGPWVKIDQGYLPGDARIRRVHRGVFELVRDFFTYKLMVGDRLIEIEMEMSSGDFNALWTVSTRRVCKMRSSLAVGNLHWDIDVLLDGQGDPYFAMAECEMPESMIAPDEILPVLLPHILFAVPRERQKEFTNTRLSDVTYARSLYG